MLPPEQVAEHLTLTTLYGADKLTEWPVFRIRVNGPSSESDPGIVSTVVASDSTNDSHTTHVLYFHLGAALCGHRHVVHGGLLATLVDELFAIQVWHEMGAAFTAQLTVDYRRPVLSNQVIRGRTWTVSKEGRKVWVRALLEGIEGPEENNALAVEKAAQMPATEEVAKRGEILVEARALFVLPREGISKAAAAAAAATSSSK
ncbi:HotDog domain-containing protein [Syncephalis plumigaleata]|nr:HotDog domain-containing protein [Syncephalis plumigaleata]